MDEQNTSVEQVQQEPQQEKQEQQERTFTQKEVDAIVKKRLDKAEAKFNERLNQLEEAQKLAQMSEQEKQQFEFDKRVQDLEAREKALKEKENAYNKQQYHNEIENQLKTKGLPTDLADLLTGFDAETVASKIDSLAQSMGNSVSNQIQEKLKQSSIPQESTQQPKALLTREQIERMTPQEYKANRDLVNESLKHLK